MALNINLFGQYGSGKGTQRKMLMEKYNLEGFEPGDIIRNEIENKTSRGIEMEKDIARGQLVPDEFIIAMLDEFFDSHPKDKGIVFDGVPRTLPQKHVFDAELKKYNKKVINIELKISEDTSFQRQINRREKRADQNENIARARIDQYKKFVHPVVDAYDQEGSMFIVDGERDIESIFKDICEIVEKYGHRFQ